MRIFVIVDDMILKNIIWQIVFREPSSHDEWLELIQEDVGKLIFFKEKEEIIEQEVPVLDCYAEFYWYGK